MLEILTDVLNYILNSCELSQALILLRSIFASVLSLLASLGLFFKSCIRSEAFLNSCTRILSHHNFRVKWKRKRGKYQRRWRPFAKLSRWIRGWILDALVILGGSAVLAVMCVSFFG